MRCMASAPNSRCAREVTRCDAGSASVYCASPNGNWRVVSAQNANQQRTRASFSWPFVISVGVLGFASGLPNVLLNDTLSAWLSDIGVDPKSIGLLAFATLPYGLKLLWAPVLDRFPAPLFGFLGIRRSWIALLCAMLFIAVLALAWVGPSTQAAPVLPVAIVALAVACLSATLDAAIDAHRTDGAAGVAEGAAASAFVMGYRVAFVSIGALILMLVAPLAHWVDPNGDAHARELAWRALIASGGAVMLIGIVAAWLAPSPPARIAVQSVEAAVIEPLRSFVRAFGSRIAIVLVVALLFRLPDLLGNRMVMPFLKQEIGFTIDEIGAVRQGFGFVMTIVGALVGGVCVQRFGLFRSLLVFGCFQVASNAGYIVLAGAGKSMPTFVGVILVENLCNGLVSAAFVAYFMELCEPRFAAAQYAILSGLMYLAGALVGGVSGWLVEELGYDKFFLLSILVGVPPLALLPFAMPKRAEAAD